MTRDARPGLRAALGTVVGGSSGVLIVLLCAGSPESAADALTGRPDAGGTSPFVALARRGEVLAPSLEDIESMCALLTSCEGLPIPRALVPADFQACTTQMTEEMTSASAVGFSLTMRECGLTSSSCASLRSCALHGARRDACRGRGRLGPVGFCDAEGRALTCWHDEAIAVRDCPRGGEQCMAENGQAKCTLGPCPADAKDRSRARCSPSATHLVRCEEGKLVSLDCVAFGLVCTTSPDGTAGCSTSGPVCVGPKGCEKDVAVGCYNGHEVRINCAAAGMVCGGPKDGAPAGGCLAPAQPTSPCEPDDKSRCDGATIKYCHAGAARAYSCRGLGFRRCEIDHSGVRCAP